MSSGNTQHLGTENNRFIDASRAKYILQQVRRLSGTHSTTEQYVHYLMNMRGPRSWQLRGSGTTTKRDSMAQGHRCEHDLYSNNTPFQRTFPEIWHDTPGQYIEYTCKLTTSINIMTNNIRIFNQLLIMQHYMSNMLWSCSNVPRDELTNRDHPGITNKPPSWSWQE